MKKSFVLYTDNWVTLKHLSNEQLGELMRMLFEYQIEGKAPEPTNPLFIAFGFIRSAMDRDLEKWNERAERARVNGSKGGRPKENQQGLEKTQKTQSVISKPKKPVNVSVSVNDSVSDNVNDYFKNNRLYKTAEDVKGKDYFKDAEVNEAFTNFLIERIARKKYPTDLAIETLQKKMREYYKTKAEALEGIEQSISNGWTGLFELNKKQSFKQPEQKVVTRASMGVKMQ